MPVRVVQLKSKKPIKPVTNVQFKTEDTTYDIWCERYRVKMNELESRSIADVKMFGVRVTGNKKIDEALKNQHIFRWITIDQMVDYNEQSCLMGFGSIEDMKKIYQALYRHLLAWRKALAYGVNIYGSPIMDLLAMDRFCDSIWTKICYYVTNSDISDDTRDMFTFDKRLDIRALFANKVLSDLGIATHSASVGDYIGTNGRFDPYKLPKRESFRDFFESKLTYM